MNDVLRMTLAENIQRRARQIAEADPAVLATFHEEWLIETDYRLESGGTALDRNEGRIDDNGDPIGEN